ncbi:hypothetical protein [Limnoglobus roseus]|uniref:SMI1/KNR4 family protein n=1 Tax=Limnoglobus roseus TaxID=2598579 RepID=A0A5C1ABQ6_9BACT|nr:hypothetical protein [Limnoglobus roseus]QEL15603.1 hypothetical protein PX52LOC_02536 [Limnoglobus roseus]
MTEAEWVRATGTDELLDLLHLPVPGRKMRLAGCACGRRVSPSLATPLFDDLLTAAERVADGQLTQGDLSPLIHSTQQLVDQDPPPFFQYAVGGIGFAAVHLVDRRYFQHGLSLLANAAAYRVAPATSDPELNDGRRMRSDPAWHEAWAAEQSAQVALLRDVFGNPFRTVNFDPAWLTPTAVGLAEAIYADRAFDRLPILADSLQDAGCEDEAILGHCRGDGVHVRGCWVLDGVLGNG